VGNYITVYDVRNFKRDGALVDLAGYEDREIEDKIELVESGLEAILNTRYYGFEETYRFDGNENPYLFFQPRVVFPLVEVESAKEYDFDQTTVLETYLENDDFIRHPHWLELKMSTGSVRDHVGKAGVWPRGQSNITIEGVWGSTKLIPGRGTVLVTAGTLSDPVDLNLVTGTGTSFFRDFGVGRLIVIEGERYTIASITSDTTLTLTEDFTGTQDIALAYQQYEIDPEVKRAALLLAVEGLVEGSTGMSRPDVLRATWPDFDIMMRSASEQTTPGFTTGYAEVDRLLAKKINYVDLFQVVPSGRQTFDGSAFKII